MKDPIRLTIDAAAPIQRIRWRVASSREWPAENTFASPAGSVVLDRPPLTDVEIEVTWATGRRRRCGFGQSRAGARGRRTPPLLGVPSLREHWHPNACENRGARTTLYVLPATATATATAAAAAAGPALATPTASPRP